MTLNTYIRGKAREKKTQLEKVGLGANRRVQLLITGVGVGESDCSEQSQAHHLQSNF